MLRVKLDEQIDIALGVEVVPERRPKEPQRPHMKESARGGETLAVNVQTYAAE